MTIRISKSDMEGLRTVNRKLAEKAARKNVPIFEEFGVRHFGKP